jgi:hypothetical protein
VVFLPFRPVFILGVCGLIFRKLILHTRKAAGNDFRTVQSAVFVICVFQSLEIRWILAGLSACGDTPAPLCSPVMSDVTAILNAIERGDAQAASQLLPLVYDELRRLAAQKLAH